VIHAFVRIVADMRNLLVCGISELFLSLDEVVIVELHLLIFVENIKVNVIISHLMLSMSLSNLKDDSGLFFLVRVVWIDKLELVVMTDIVILVNGLLAFDTGINNDAFFLD
jgi:hypothetical protein